MADTDATWEPLQYGERYYIQTAKSNITSLIDVFAEALSNDDEAIRERAARRGEANSGHIAIRFDPATRELTVTDNGIGMTAAEMRDRMQQVGQQALAGAERSFFHRGIREVFTALGESTVESVALDENGRRVFSSAVFHPRKGMAQTDS